MTTTKKPLRHTAYALEATRLTKTPSIRRGAEPLGQNLARPAPFSGQHVLDITLRRDPQFLIEATRQAVDCEHLRDFLGTVLAERDVAQALARGRGNGHPPPIVSLRRAAEMARCWSAFGAQERETLFVATVLRGVQELLADQVVGSRCTPSELVFAIARSALHRLDDAAPRPASLLRLALGWGNEDEIDAFYVPRIQHTVMQALSSVGLVCAHLTLN